ncbi:unnamed protein product [Allacma fusca]|uniref:UDP-glucuronosyltransferase n=1 Tax=Allacma fusca TaxID=39272 RepID=A0A8J2K143_9HEXA|nr:unnamed protein product [Allacma fusca]
MEISKKSLLFLILTFTLSSTLTQGANILFFLGVSTYSHRILVWPLAEKLVELGHDVTFVSSYQPKNPNPNITEFVSKSLQELIDAKFGDKADLIELRELGEHTKIWDDVEELGVTMCEVLMKDPEYISLIKSKRYDLVVIDFLDNECALGIVRYHKAKFIIFDTNHPAMWQHDSFGMPAETSWVPDLPTAYPHDMGFLHRFANTFWPLRWYFNRVYFMYPKMEAAINEGFGWVGDERISLREMELDTSLVLMNSHFSVDYARSLPPLYIPVCGLHIKPATNQLPKDIQKFADESGDSGFIYVSFGSAVQFSKAKPQLRDAFFKAFENSPVRFIWKWEGPRPKEMPSNVLTASWMPQADVLAHPKIKAFITHAGLLGTSEAIVHAVPLIAFPCFAEQDYNSDRMEHVGYGIRMEFVGLKQQDLHNAIVQILTNPRYKENMLEIQKRFTDRQNDPLDTAVWWTEYVLRNKKSRLMMPLGRYQYWFVRRSLDIWGSIIGIICIFLGIIMGYILCRSRTNGAVSQPDPSKKNR